MAISMAAAIEKLRLFADQGGFSLAMSVDSDTHRVNSPGTPLEAITCFLRTARRFISPVANPDGMGFMPAINPGQIC